METIITAGGKGVRVNGSNVAESFRCLQVVVFLEKMLDEKIPGNRFEIGRIKCGRKKQKRIKKKMKGVRSWVMFLEISEGDSIILVPSLKALGEAVQPITDRLCEKYHLPTLEYDEDRRGRNYGEWKQTKQMEKGEYLLALLEDGMTTDKMRKLYERFLDSRKE